MAQSNFIKRTTLVFNCPGCDYEYKVNRVFKQWRDSGCCGTRITIEALEGDYKITGHLPETEGETKEVDVDYLLTETLLIVAPNGLLSRLQSPPKGSGYTHKVLDSEASVKYSVRVIKHEDGDIEIGRWIEEDIRGTENESQSDQTL